MGIEMRLKSYINWWSKWFQSTNHKDIGTIYLLYGRFGRILRTTISLGIRLELVSSINLYLIEEHAFNVLTTRHRLVIIFFFLIPALISRFGNWIIPIYMGLADMAFPRINNLSFWLLLPSLLFVFISLVHSRRFRGRWTIYPPLSSYIRTPNPSIDCLIFALHMARASSIIGRINFMVTVTIFGRKGLSFYNLNLFIWAYYVTVFLLVLSLPVLAAGITLILFDRNLRTSFFDPGRGGDPLLFQHLFWFFGHPEVYVLILPRFRIISQQLTFYSMNSTGVGYYAIAWAIISIAFMGCIVWAHHIFTTRLDLDTRAYFTAASLVIRVPTGVKVFTWCAIIWNNRIDFNGVVIWLLRFLILFTFRGITGLLLANASIDLVMHDTYFVVAHFHFVLSISAVFSLISGMYHWMPTLTRINIKYDYCIYHFMCIMVRVLLVFTPIHIIGLCGINRRYVSYDDKLVAYNEVITFGLTISGYSIVFPLIAILERSFYGNYMIIHDQSLEMDQAYRNPVPNHTHIQSPALG